jgi:hypothetical protein
VSECNDTYVAMGALEDMVSLLSALRADMLMSLRSESDESKKLKELWKFVNQNRGSLANVGYLR